MDDEDTLLARISHKFSDEGGQDVTPGSFSKHREHYQVDKARGFEDEDGVTDCPDSPSICEEYGLNEIDQTLFLKNLTIFDRESNHESIPAGFTAATVRIDATPSSTLEWTEELIATHQVTRQGYKVCFDLDLGLTSSEFKGVTHQGQFQASILALDEFRKRFLLPFFEHTAAVILYRSNSSFSSYEARDIQVDYLDLLRRELPDECNTLVLFDCKELQDPYEFARMFAHDRFSLYTLALASAPVLQSCLSWRRGDALLGYIGRDVSHYAPKECSIGVVMPRFFAPAEMQRLTLQRLTAEKKPFKIISEDFLALEWENLDELYVHEKSLAPTTLRKLAGFEAAGGIVYRSGV